MRPHNGLVLFASAFCISLSLISCAKTPPPPPPSPREELVGSLKDANLEGFYFETRDSDAEEVAAMTNRIVAEPIKMDSDATVVLRYARVTEKKTNTTTTYKVEAIRAGDQLTFQVTDMASGASLIKQSAEFPALPAATGATCPPGFPPFNSLDDCVCSLRATLLVTANQTCQPQLGAATCCINGNLISAHILVQPTRFLCQLGPIENFDDLVFFKG